MVVFVCLALCVTACAEDRAVKAYLAGDLDGAVRLLTGETRKPGARPSRYLLLGRIHFMRGQWKDAQGVLGSLLELDPGNPHGAELLGRALHRLGKFEEALPYYERSVLESDQPDLRVEYAEVLMETDQKTEAVAALKRVVLGDEPSPRAHFLLGRLRLEAGTGHWARRELWAAWKQGYRDPDLNILLARAFTTEGRITGPLSIEGPITDGKPGTMLAARLLIRPMAAHRPGFWYVCGPDTALYQVELALAVDSSVRVRMLAARCWLEAGVPERAAGFLDSIPATTEGATLIRAKTSLALGDVKGCRAALAELIDQSRAPYDDAVGLLLELALERQVAGDASAAVNLLEEADELAPGRADVLRALVNALAQLGRTGDASEKARLLASLHPDSPDVKRFTGRWTVQPGERKEGEL